MANISTISYNGKVIAETEEPGNVVVTYDGRTIAEIVAGESKNILCNGKVMKTNLYVGGKTLLCGMAQMISDIVIAVKSAFPEAPTAYSLISTYTSNGTFTAPEDGYFQIEVFGASGNSGTTAYKIKPGGSNCNVGGGGGGGGGGYSVSRVKLKQGDTLTIVCGAVGSTSSAIINSSVESYSEIQVTSGANGTNGAATSSSITVGIGGAGGVASGGNYSNINGNAGNNGGNPTISYGQAAAGSGAGGLAINGGNAGGTSASVELKLNMTKLEYYVVVSGETSGSAGFIKIYRGNTNVGA